MMQEILSGDVSVIKMLFPEKEYVEYVPILKDGYILNVDMKPWKFRDRFKDSILINNSIGKNINNRDVLIKILEERGYKRAKLLRQLPDDVFKKNLVYFLILKSLPKELEEKAQSVYKVMKQIGNWQRTLREYFTVELYFKSKMNILLSFLRNAVWVENTGNYLNPKYRSDLKMLKTKIKMPVLRKALLQYVKSEQTELDVLYFLMRLG